MSKKIPKYLIHLFWDVKIEKIDLKIHSKFVISRILNFGDERAIKWLKKEFSDNEIKSIIKNNRYLDKKTLNFLKLYYEIS